MCQKLAFTHHHPSHSRMILQEESCMFLLVRTLFVCQCQLITFFWIMTVPKLSSHPVNSLISRFWKWVTVHQIVFNTGLNVTSYYIYIHKYTAMIQMFFNYLYVCFGFLENLTILKQDHSRSRKVLRECTESIQHEWLQTRSYTSYSEPWTTKEWRPKATSWRKNTPKFRWIFL